MRFCSKRYTAYQQSKFLINLICCLLVNIKFGYYKVGDRIVNSVNINKDNDGQGVWNLEDLEVFHY